MPTFSLSIHVLMGTLTIMNNADVFMLEHYAQ
jgi:hypothetical protein